MKITALRLLIAIALLVLLQSCSTVYYVGQIPDQVYIYPDASLSSAAYVSHAPSNTTLLIKKKSSKYYYIIYDSYEGYIPIVTLRNYHRFKSNLDGIFTDILPTKAKPAGTRIRY